MAKKRCKATTASGNRCRNNAVEGSVYCAVHKAKPKAKTTTAKKATTKKAASARCDATTASGSRCRNNAVDGSDFCAVHGKRKTTAKKATTSKSTRCTATTQAGKRCRNDSVDGSKFCAVHNPNAGSDDMLGELAKLVESLQKGKSTKKKGYSAPDFSGPALLKLLIEFLTGGGKTSGLGALSALRGASSLLVGTSQTTDPEPADSGVSLVIPSMNTTPASGAHLSADPAEMGTVESIWVLLNYARDNPGRSADAIKEQLGEIMGRLDLGLGR